MDRKYSLDTSIIATSIFDISVVVPTFNGADRLPSLLEGVRKLLIPKTLSWEIIVIDNNSTDNTDDVVKSLQQQWQRCPFRCGFEPRQGAAYARRAGVDLAQGHYIVFVDDDVLLDPHWIVRAWEFARIHSDAGAIAGPIIGNYEAPPPDGFARIQGYLAVRDYPAYNNQISLFSPEALRLPPSAALLVNRQAWLEAVPREQILTGRTPQLLVQGDDYEPLLHLHRQGWKIWFVPELVSYHQIPAWRLTQQYLLDIARACGLATYTLRLVNASRSQHMYLAWKTILGNLKRLLIRGLEWLFSNPSMRKIIRIEIAFLSASCWSPIFHYRQLCPQFRARLAQSDDCGVMGAIAIQD